MKETEVSQHSQKSFARVNSGFTEVTEESPPPGEKPYIGSIMDCPDWLKDDYFIRGYRINHTTFKDNFYSIVSAHNETLNIWTHLVAALFFVCAAIFVIMNSSSIKHQYQVTLASFKINQLGASINKTVNIDSQKYLEGPKLKGNSDA